MKNDNKKYIAEFKTECNNSIAEFNVFSVNDFNCKSEDRKRIFEGLTSVEEQIEKNENIINELNKDIDKLTNHADGIDNMVAVASGIIAGIIDSVWVGEFSLERASNWGDEKTNKFVVKVAQSQGYKGNDLTGAITYLEKKYPLSSDSVTAVFGGGRQHHLRDFAHHPTPIGLTFSLLTQFTGNAYGTDTFGKFIVVPVENKSTIGNDLTQKILFGFVFWMFHMVSDMAGSSSAAGGGTGLPGPLVSLLKELSVLPFFKDLKVAGYEFSVWISKLFNGTLTNVKFDLRTEIGIAHELGRQAVPVIINECIVRGFYFIRRLLLEFKNNDIKNLSELKNVNLDKVLPFNNNRTIVRMLTIATGTFTAIDLADAAIRSAIKSGGVNPAFFANMVLRVNFVGIGRLAVAIYTDTNMGLKKNKKISERIEIMSEQLVLYNAKVSYRQADMWCSAKDTTIALQELYEIMQSSMEFMVESFLEIESNLEKISEHIPKIEEHNEGLTDELLDILIWG